MLTPFWQVECRVLSNGTAQWRNTQCSQRSASQSTVQHTLRPCCGELDGQCTLTSPQHCWFMNGWFHLDAEHCSQVLGAQLNSNDFDDFCSFLIIKHWHLCLPYKLNFTQFENRNVNILSRRLYSPSLKEVAWPEDLDLTFLVLHTFVCKSWLGRQTSRFG